MLEYGASSIGASARSNPLRCNSSAHSAIRITRAVGWGYPPRGDHVLCEFDQPPVEDVFSHVSSLAGRDNALVTLLTACSLLRRASVPLWRDGGPS